MLLSVIIPVYNTAEYLRKCVESVLDSDFVDFEVVLVDDGSTDGKSPALCDELCAEYEKVRVIHQENRGLGGARNTGIESAEGEYLLFLDSDDTLVIGALDVLAGAVAASGAELYSFDMISEDPAGVRAPLMVNNGVSGGPFTLKERPEFLRSIPSACCRIWKKSLFLNSGVRFPDRVWYEDIRTTTKLYALASSIVVLPDNLYVYYTREGSIMRSANVDRNREIIWAFDDLLNWYREQGLFETYRLELWRLCVDHLYLSASVRVLVGDPGHKLLREFSDYVKTQFGKLKMDGVGFLPRRRRVVWYLMRLKCYRLLRLLFARRV